MAKIQLIVEGGKASVTPQLAQTLGPLKIPLNEVVGAINEQTASFQGIKVPVTVIVNEKDKSYEVRVGSPPMAELIKKELTLEKGSGTPNKVRVANIGIEQLIKIAKMKMGGIFDRSLKAAVKSVAGTCNSLGILVEGKLSKEFNSDLDHGVYDNELREEQTEMSPEKQERLRQQLQAVQEELQKEQEKLKAAEAAKVAEQAAEPEQEEPAKEGEKKPEAPEKKKVDATAVKGGKK